MSKPALSDVSLKKIRQSAGVAPADPTVRQPGRVGKTHLTIFISHAVKDQLRMLGIERKLTLQEQTVEALNDYFAKHGKPETAQ